METIFFLVLIFSFGAILKQYQKFLNSYYRYLAALYSTTYLNKHEVNFFGNGLHIPREDNHEFNFYWPYTRYINKLNTDYADVQFDNYFLENQNKLYRFCIDNSKKWREIYEQLVNNKMHSAKVITHADFFNERDVSEEWYKALNDSFERSLC